MALRFRTRQQKYIRQYSIFCWNWSYYWAEKDKRVCVTQTLFVLKNLKKKSPSLPNHIVILWFTYIWFERKSLSVGSDDRFTRRKALFFFFFFKLRLAHASPWTNRTACDLSMNNVSKTWKPFVYENLLKKS